MMVMETTLKGTPTDGNAIFTFNFGQTLAAGTELHFSMYVYNEDNSTHSWFQIIVNGLNKTLPYSLAIIQSCLIYEKDPRHLIYYNTLING